MSEENLIIYKSDNSKKPQEALMKAVEPEYFVKKANELVEAHYHLTAAELKLVIAAISLINKDDRDFKEYVFTIQDVLKLLEIRDHSYHLKLRERFESIMKKTITLNGDPILICTWFSCVEINKKKGTVGVCFTEKLKPYLLDLHRKFTSYRLKYIGCLKSASSIRIYELLKGIEKTKNGRREFELKDLRSILGFQNKYKTYSHFKNRVLVSARNELDKKADITFSFKEKKIGRKVEWIIFFVVENKPDEKGQKIQSKGRLPDNLIELIPDEKSLNSSIELCKTIYREKGESCLKYYIEEVNTVHQLLGDELRSYGAYMRKLYNLNKWEGYLKAIPEDLRDILITSGEYLRIGDSPWYKVQKDKAINVEGKIYTEIDLKRGIIDGKIKRNNK